MGLLSNSVQNPAAWQRGRKSLVQLRINDAYVAELAHFMECVQTGARPRFTLQDAILTLRIAWPHAPRGGQEVVFFG